jgi:hypothetical protein
MTKISPNFELSEFLKSETAMRKGIKEQYIPPKEVVDNLMLLAQNIAEPIRAKFGSFSPTQGYRCPRLNKLISKSTKSEHLFGKAFDETFIDASGANISRQVFNWILAGGLKKWSKLILEYPDKNGVPRWLHIGYDKDNLNNQVLVVDKENPNGINYFTSKYSK